MNPVKKILGKNSDVSKDRGAYLDNTFTPEQLDDWWMRSTPQQRAKALKASGNPNAAKSKEFIEYNKPHLPVMTAVRLATYLGQRRK